MKALVVLAFCVAALAPLGVRAQDKKSGNNPSDSYQVVNDAERVYNVRPDTLWEKAEHAAYRDFEVDSEDADKFTIQMHTKVSLASNGVHVTVTLEREGADKTRIKVKAEKKSGVFFWSSPTRIVRNYFKDIDSQLAGKS
ncbi:MAG TPA: hypothetical protein VEZ90_08150 [Blastocatellia bacterium]|nr:hypothetical protein [Blastocatellia bacterium]